MRPLLETSEIGTRSIESGADTIEIIINFAGFGALVLENHGGQALGTPPSRISINTFRNSVPARGRERERERIGDPAAMTDRPGRSPPSTSI